MRCGCAAICCSCTPAAQHSHIQTWTLLSLQLLWAFAKDILRGPQAVTFASALNDVGSWALVAWQATFYQRVFEVGPDVYAPLLAAIIPIGGIIGGVGGGLAGDWLSRKGGRAWLTVGERLHRFCTCRFPAGCTGLARTRQRGEIAPVP